MSGFIENVIIPFCIVFMLLSLGTSIAQFDGNFDTQEQSQ